jgi:hypothetical protein
MESGLEDEDQNSDLDLFFNFFKMNSLRLRYPLRALSSASKPGQLLNQFLHGRPPADRSGLFDDERSTHSKRLARGKYVHELCGTPSTRKRA